MKLPIQEDQIEKQTEINAPIERVWRALTDHREFGEWFGVAIERPFAVGETSHGHMTIPGYEHIKWNVVVQKIDAERFVFEYTWHPYAIDPERDYSNETPTRVEFRLARSGDGTSLTVTDSGFSKLPADRQVDALRMNTGGWEQQLKDVREHAEQNG